MLDRDVNTFVYSSFIFASMAKEFTVIPFEQMWSMTMQQVDNGAFMGIDRHLFSGIPDPVLRTLRFGQVLDTPFGVAAGPHSQLSQNIVAAWLCGARFIELKTIQTLDELNVTKPCIDMQDEGYNCEWSQELKIKESLGQYLDAWIMIHMLNHRLYGKNEPGAGTIFNMSAGYNLEGIMQQNVQWFFDQMNDCSEMLSEKIDAIRPLYPAIDELHIPSQISNNITLSTMHGCPPDEIENIALYLIRERKLHTTVKLNPTLLGPEMLRWILNGKLGYTTHVPDEAFAHDLKFSDALKIIRNLQQAAAESQVFFGLKLTNTLESLNVKGTLPLDEKMHYMSGRALHPLSVHLASKLQTEFDGMLDISFSAGADAFNIAELLRCGLGPVTMSSDLLKPGGYGRLKQYSDEIKHFLWEHAIPDVMSLIPERGKLRAVMLKDYTAATLEDKRYRKSMREPNIKTRHSLGYFDCIHAPCVNTCPTNQEIPQYLHHVAKGEFQKAFEVIMRTNPMPNTTGGVCDHECQTKCTRINYDENVAIREVKRWVSDLINDETFIRSLPNNGHRAAVVGAGPAGISCAYFLLLAGFTVDVYEEKPFAGGMVADVIPSFRLKAEAIRRDIERVEKLGARLHYGTRVDKAWFDALRSEGRYIFVATGAPIAKKLGIKGEESGGVLDPLVFLSQTKKGMANLPGKRVLVVGGGNTAMDVARAARRIQDGFGSVVVVYRRRVADMPAEVEEIQAALAEGVIFAELMSPVEVVVAAGQVGGLRVRKMKVAGKDSSGRMQVEPMAGSDEILVADVVIPAIGQDARYDFMSADQFQGDKPYSTKLERVFAGGDVRQGPANIISAVADGRRAAEAIIEAAGVLDAKRNDLEPRNSDRSMLMQMKGRRVWSKLPDEHEEYSSKVIRDAGEAMEEASRCLLCDELCNICVTVCPNLANQHYETEPFSIDLNQGKFEIRQKVQTYNIGEFCNECGNCQTFCPTSGAPYRDKPRVWLTKSGFDHALYGFFYDHSGRMMFHKEDGCISSLAMMGSGYLFRKSEEEIVFGAQFQCNDLAHASDDSIVEAAGMMVLMQIFK